MTSRIVLQGNPPRSVVKHKYWNHWPSSKKLLVFIDISVLTSGSGFQSSQEILRIFLLNINYPPGNWHISRSKCNFWGIFIFLLDMFPRSLWRVFLLEDQRLGPTAITHEKKGKWSSEAPWLYSMLIFRGVHPWKLTCALKRDYFNRKYIFQPLIFRGHVNFPGVTN